MMPPMAVGVAIFGVAVSVGDWAVVEALVPDGGSVPPASLVGTAGENSGSSWWNKN